MNKFGVLFLSLLISSLSLFTYARQNESKKKSQSSRVEKTKKEKKSKVQNSKKHKQPMVKKNKPAARKAALKKNAKKNHAKKTMAKKPAPKKPVLHNPPPVPKRMHNIATPSEAPVETTVDVEEISPDLSEEIDSGIEE